MFYEELRYTKAGGVFSSSDANTWDKVALCTVYLCHLAGINAGALYLPHVGQA